MIPQKAISFDNLLNIHQPMVAPQKLQIQERNLAERGILPGGRLVTKSSSAEANKGWSIFLPLLVHFCENLRGLDTSEPRQGHGDSAPAPNLSSHPKNKDQKRRWTRCNPSVKRGGVQALLWPGGSGGTRRKHRPGGP